MRKYWFEWWSGRRPKTIPYADTVEIDMLDDESLALLASGIREIQVERAQARIVEKAMTFRKSFHEMMRAVEESAPMYREMAQVINYRMRLAHEANAGRAFVRQEVRRVRKELGLPRG